MRHENERRRAKEEAERRVECMCLMIANELGRQRANMKPIGQMVQLSMNRTGKSALSFSDEDSDAIWRFCVFAHSRIPMEIYRAYLTELPQLGAQTCQTILDAYDVSRNALAEALRMRESFDGPKPGNVTWETRSTILTEICKQAVEKLASALKLFEEESTMPKDATEDEHVASRSQM